MIWVVASWFVGPALALAIGYVVTRKSPRASTRRVVAAAGGAGCLSWLILSLPWLFGLMFMDDALYILGFYDWPEGARPGWPLVHTFMFALGPPAAFATVVLRKRGHKHALAMVVAATVGYASYPLLFLLVLVSMAF